MTDSDGPLVQLQGHARQDVVFSIVRYHHLREQEGTLLTKNRDWRAQMIEDHADIPGWSDVRLCTATEPTPTQSFSTQPKKSTGIKKRKRKRKREQKQMTNNKM